MDCACALIRRRVAGSRIYIKTNKQSFISVSCPLFTLSFFFTLITEKKKSKFQTFKKLFARKKRKDSPAPGEEAGLTASQSSDNVNSALEDETLARAENEKGSG